MKYSFIWYGIAKGAKAKQAHYIPNLKRAALYTPTETKNIVADIRMQSMPNKPPQPLDSALAVEVAIYLPIPTMSAKKKALAIYGKLLPSKKPDLDNIEKALWDALQGVYYTNDSRICDKRIRKFYSEVPRIEVEIWEIEN
jgi:Holliday junction resolvase RusA-like endonuclease